MSWSWSDRVYGYCERGLDPGFWAEPANALSNAAFLLAALAAAAELVRRRPDLRPDLRPGLPPNPPLMVSGLVGLVALIGAGSFLFHTFANRWSALADVLPIGLFMVAYLTFALRWFTGGSWLWTVLGVAALVFLMRTAGAVHCRMGLLSVAAAAHGSCFNGTLGYAPALAAMTAVGGLLAARAHPAAWYLLAAAAVFLGAMVLRTIDWEVCGATRVFGRARGTHALWHVLNAIALYILLAAAIRHGRTPGSRVPAADVVER